MKSILITSILLFTIIFTQAQEEWCGSSAIQYTEEEQRTVLSFMNNLRPDNTISRERDSVAVTVHIVKSVASSPAGLTQAQIEAQIKKTNNAYGVESGLFFFLCGSPRVINGQATYNFNQGDELNRSYHVANTINIFVVEEAEVDPTFPICGYARFPFFKEPQDRYIVIDINCWNDGSVLPHELGHFYGLYHTHESAFGLEHVNRSNCTSAGDLLCDTPADPNLSIPGVMNGCSYIGNYVDPLGERYVPMVANIMAYAPPSCQNILSSEQKAVVNEVHKTANSYLIGNCDFYPDFGVEPEFSSKTIRSDEDIKITYNFQTAGIDKDYNALFKIILQDPDGSGIALYEEDILIPEGQKEFSRTLDLDFPITKGTGEYILEATMDAESKIIERTETNNQAITTIEVDNSSLDDVLVFPNPTTDLLKLFFRDARASGAFKMRVFAYDGRFILEQEGFKNREEFFQIIDVSHVNKGLYILKVDFERSNKEYVFKFLKL